MIRLSAAQLRDETRRPQRSYFDADLTLEAVATHFGLTRAELAGRSRERHVAGPRQVAMLLLCRAGYSKSAVGRLLGRDHSTVSTGAAMTEWRARYDADLRADIETISITFKGMQGGMAAMRRAGGST